MRGEAEYKGKIMHAVSKEMGVVKQWLSSDVIQQHWWVLGIVYVQWWHLSQNRGFAPESL